MADEVARLLDEAIAAQRESGRAERAAEAAQQRYIAAADALGVDTGRLEVTILLPLMLDVWAQLTVPHPLSAAEWDQLLTTLTAMRPGLVREEADDAE